MDDLLAALVPAIDGLLVQSETDVPLSLFVWPAPLPFTPTILLAIQSLPVDTPVEISDLHRFFGTRTRIRPGYSDDERTTAVRFQQLQGILETHLTDIQVVRVGTIEIDVWIIGHTPDNRIIGLTTLLVET